jgi:antitoxin MazE
MNAQLRKWGNSLAIRLPRTVVQAAKLREGDQLELIVPGPGQVELKTAKEKLTLAQLVRRITPQNRHGETDWGKPMGGELW